MFGDTDRDDEIRVSIITGIDRDRPNDYKVIIGSKLPDVVSHDAGDRFILVSRINRMSPLNSQNLTMFTRNFEAAKRYVLLPAHFKDQTTAPEIMSEYGLEKRQLVIKPMWQIEENDPDCVAVGTDDLPIIPPFVKDPPIFRMMKRRELIRKNKKRPR